MRLSSIILGASILLITNQYWSLGVALGSVVTSQLPVEPPAKMRYAEIQRRSGFVDQFRPIINEANRKLAKIDSKTSSRLRRSKLASEVLTAKLEIVGNAFLNHIRSDAGITNDRVHHETMLMAEEVGARKIYNEAVKEGVDLDSSEALRAVKAAFGTSDKAMFVTEMRNLAGRRW